MVAVLASTASAQTRLSTELFVARNNNLSSGASLFGLGLTMAGGPLGIRASGALALRTEDVEQTDVVRLGAWTAEVDLMLRPALLGWNDRAGLAFAPYVFGGLGRISGVEVDDSRSIWTGVSYGAGVELPLTRAFGITGEARYRLPLAEAIDENNGFDRSFPRGWEYRFGLAISLGG